VEHFVNSIIPFVSVRASNYGKQSVLTCINIAASCSAIFPTVHTRKEGQPQPQPDSAAGHENLRRAGVPAAMRTKYLRNRNVESCRYSMPVGDSSLHGVVQIVFVLRTIGILLANRRDIEEFRKLYSPSVRLL
jgi:hypothetical protein